ncbi:MAG: 2-C-methyl-D-erythritol 2,4-cyclodiphosphate synthase [candidate division WOR-3 bacterium]
MFARNRKLILGGEEIPFKYGLAGHSDADVLIHAIVDALLGAAGLRDIGHYFPDSDKRWRNISSLMILKKVTRLLRKKKIKIVNIDSCIIAQEPKISPYVEKMKKQLAEILKIKEEYVSIKGKTTEGMGFTGRREGICAIAVCQVLKR